jgi:hypothetical protein
MSSSADSCKDSVFNLLLSFEAGVPITPVFWRDIQCPQNEFTWRPNINQINGSFQDIKYAWCPIDDMSDAVKCPLPFIQSMIIPTNMKVGFRAKWNNTLASRLEERGKIWVTPDVNFSGVNANLGKTPLTWKRDSDGTSECLSFNSNMNVIDKQIGKDPVTKKEVIDISDLNDLKAFKGKLRKSIVSCGSPFLPSVSIFDVSGRRCDKLDWSPPPSGEGWYYRRTGYMTNNKYFDGKYALTPAQGALSELLNNSTLRSNQNKQNLNPFQICYHSDPAPQTVEGYKELDNYFMNFDTFGTNGRTYNSYDGYTPGTTISFGPQINNIYWGTNMRGVQGWHSGDATYEDYGGKTWSGDLQISNSWIYEPQETISNYAFDRMCDLPRRQKGSEYPGEIRDFTPHHFLKSQNIPALKECAGYNTDMLPPASYVAVSTCDCVPDSMYHYLSWVAWNTINYGTVNLNPKKNEQYPLMIEACNCPQKWRVEGNVDQFAVSYKNHQWGWDYEKAMLCSQQWTVSIENQLVSAYHHGSPICDDHMINYCQQATMIETDARLKESCSCINQSQTLQQQFKDVELSLHCLINSCADARKTVYKTAKQLAQPCTQHICEQIILIIGSSISVQGDSNVNCRTFESITDTQIIDISSTALTSTNLSRTSSAKTVSKTTSILSITTSSNRFTLLAITSIILCALSFVLLGLLFYKRHVAKKQLLELEPIDNRSLSHNKLYS